LGGKDVTNEFYELHRRSVLEKYAKLRIGRIAGSAAPPSDDELKSAVSKIPYAESSWLQGHESPYYDESHRALQREVHNPFAGSGSESTPH
jgi:hypothetical protein